MKKLFLMVILSISLFSREPVLLKPIDLRDCEVLYNMTLYMKFKSLLHKGFDYEAETYYDQSAATSLEMYEAFECNVNNIWSLKKMKKVFQGI